MKINASTSDLNDGNFPASLDLIRAIADQSKDWTYLLGADNHFLYSSPAFKEISGFEFTIIKDDPEKLSDILHPDDRNIWESHHREHSGTSEACKTEFRIIDKSGTTRWIRHDCHPMYNSNGQFLGRWAQNRDISVRKQNDAKLAGLIRFNKNIIDSAPVGIVTINHSGQVTSANPAFLKMMGSPGLDSTLSLNISLPTIRESGILDALKQALNSGVPFEMPRLPYTSYWGKQLYVNLKGVPEYSAEGKITGIVLVVNDVTATVKAEEGLQISQTLYSAVFDQSGEGLALADSSGKYVAVNPAFCRVTGYDQDELLQLTVRDLLPPVAEITLFPLVKSGQSGSKRSELVRKDGSRFMADISGYPVQLGDELLVLGITRDITTLIAGEQLRQENIHFLQVMEKIDQVIFSSGSIDEMLNAVLEELLAIFGCDRAMLLFPCNPAADEVRVPYEKTAPECTGMRSNGEAIPIDSTIRVLLEAALSSNQVVSINQDTVSTLPGAGLFQKYNIKSYMMQVIQPRVGERWLLSLQQCSQDRAWSSHDQKLFREIGSRISDSLGSLLLMKSLKESEERFRNLAEKSPVAVAVYIDGKVAYANKATWQAMGGSSVEDLLGRNFLHHVHPDSMDLVRNRLARIQSGEQPEPAEIKFLTLDGRVIEAMVYTALITFDQHPALLSQFIDITERKRIERARQESEEHLELALQGANLGLWDWNILTGQVTFNRQYAEMLGYKLEELAGKDKVWESLVHPDELSRVQEQLQDHLSGQSASFESEYRMQTRSGGWKWILDRGRILEWDEQGQPIRAAGTHLDISARRNAEDALRESEAANRRLATLVEQSSESIVVTDLEGLMVYVNPAFEKLTGFSAGEAIGQNPNILKSGRQPAKLYNELWTTLRQDKTWAGRYINRRKDGTFFEEEAVIFPIRDEQGKTINYCKIARDISLETRLEEQLRQAHKMEAIGTLAGGVAHDFNNLLTVINGYAELALLKTDASHPVQKDIKAILNSGKSAEGLTKQLLAFSRKQIHKPENLSINEIVHSMETILQRLIGEDIRMESNLAENLPPILADKTQIEQIITNLVINARDALIGVAIPGLDKQLKIETAAAVIDDTFNKENTGCQKGAHILITISDNGMGMEPKVLQKIFEPFYSTKAKSKGTGLGLATVYGIVHQNKACIFVESEPGSGTTFKIYWPASSGKIRKPARTEAAGDQTGSESVLVVEDNSEVRKFIMEALSALGYDVRSASNGQEALELIGQGDTSFDLLITDMIMPGLSGKELSDQVKTQIPEIRVIYISGYTDNQIVQNGSLQSGIHFIHKPFSINTLAGEVRRVLDLALYRNSEDNI